MRLSMQELKPDSLRALQVPGRWPARVRRTLQVLLYVLSGTLLLLERMP